MMMLRLIHTKVNPVIFKPLIEHGYQGLKLLREGSMVKRDGDNGDDISPGRLDVSNQWMQTGSDATLNQIETNFPPSISIGYGSGVFEQVGYETQHHNPPQIDLIKIVKDTKQFHHDNLKLNHHHYSGIRWLGVNYIEFWQNLGEVKLYFNPFIKVDDSIIKYGIVSEKNALKDLVEWENFYISGRLQKPVKFLCNDNNAQDLQIIEFANQYNLFCAFIISILINKHDVINDSKLFENITSLSYLGDPRMKIGGENPNKVKNIVNKQYDNFIKLYQPFLQYFIAQKYLISQQPVDGKNDYLINLTNTDKLKLLGYLPKNFRVKLGQTNIYNILSENINIDDHSKELTPLTRSNKPDNVIIPKVIKTTLSNLMLRPTLVQSIKGFFTAGIIKSLKYMIEKRMKYLKVANKS